MADRDRFGPHSDHDLEIVAMAADDHLEGPDRIRAEDLLATCPDCAALAADLRTIAVSTRALGSAFGGDVARAPRDFRLSESDARRLRGRGPRSGSLGLSRLWGRRLGGALATMGLVGLLVSAAPMSFLGAAGSAAADRTAQDVAASANPAALAPVSSGLLSQAAPAPETGAANDQPNAAEPVGGLPPLGIVAGAALVVGLALLVATREGRRAGP